VQQTLVGIGFLAGMAWALAGLVRHLLRRGKQITYMVPMTPKAEDRMLQCIQFVAPMVLIGVAVCIAFRADSPLGALLAIGVAGLIAFGLARSVRSARRRPEPPPKHKT
jgi:hypothetical protein